MRTIAILATLLLAVPLAVAESSVVAEGRFSFVGAHTVEDSFTLPAGTTALSAGVGALQTAPLNAYVVTATLLRDGLPIGTPCVLAGTPISVASGCVLGSTVSGSDDAEWSIRIDGAGSATVRYVVEAQ